MRTSFTQQTTERKLQTPTTSVSRRQLSTHLHPRPLLKALRASINPQQFGVQDVNNIDTDLAELIMNAPNKPAADDAHVHPDMIKPSSGDFTVAAAAEAGGGLDALFAG